MKVKYEKKKKNIYLELETRRSQALVHFLALLVLLPQLRRVVAACLGDRGDFYH